MVKALVGAGWISCDEESMRRALIIGLDHAIQRKHPDEGPELEKTRVVFENALRRVIQERSVQLLAEEAGDDIAVATELQKEQNTWADATGQLPKKIEPQPTVAKRLALGNSLIKYVDVRPPGQKTTDEEYEGEMLSGILEAVGSAESILVLCGEGHRAGLSKLLSSRGLEVEDRPFEWLLKTLGVHTDF